MKILTLSMLICISVISLLYSNPNEDLGYGVYGGCPLIWMNEMQKQLGENLPYPVFNRSQILRSLNSVLDKKNYEMSINTFCYRELDMLDSIGYLILDMLVTIPSSKRLSAMLPSLSNWLITTQRESVINLSKNGKIDELRNELLAEKCLQDLSISNNVSETNLLVFIYVNENAKKDDLELFKLLKKSLLKI